MKITRYAIVVLAVTLALASCSGVKNLKAPELNLPPAIALASVDSATIADADWWQIYSDSTLTRIIRRVLANNHDLKIAADRIEELRQLYGIDRLVYTPTVTGLIGADRETNHYSGEKPKADTETDLKVTLNWEIDLWGGLSQQQRRSAALYNASVEDRRALQMTLIAEAATAYFNLVALSSELDIVRRTLVTRSEGVEKARLRYEGGLTSEVVYQQAQVEYATTAALVPALESRIARARNAITLLMGEFPDAEIGTVNLDLMHRQPDQLPATVSSSLLERRPDLRASRERLRAAMAQCGVAYSDQFPRLRISLTGGWENDGLARLLASPFSYILGSITGTVFDFGRNRRRYRAAVAAYDQARHTYERTVTAAFTEVADAIAVYNSVRLTVERRIQLRDAAYKYVTLTNRQYTAGSISYIDVMDSYRRYFDAQTSLVNAVRDQYLAMVNLYKALGGGAQ